MRKDRITISVSGHWRVLPNGKRLWVKPYKKRLGLRTWGGS